MKSANNHDIPFIEPMECLPVDNLPDGPDWIYELKLDGYRGQAIRDERGVRLLSRRGKDFSRKFTGVFAALKDCLPLGIAVDGEVVAFDETGQLSFNALQNADADATLVFFAFDVLVYRWKDTKHLPLSERMSLLKTAIRPSERVQLSEHFPGPAGKFLEAVRQMGGEGVVAKRLNSRYEPGREAEPGRRGESTLDKNLSLAASCQEATASTLS
jgi:ATP-dependent DNA ligase